MAALILPSRRIAQPQGPVQIDWSHPLARRLAAAFIGGVPVDLVSGQAATLVNYPALHVGQYGRGWRTGNGTLARVDVPTPGLDQLASEWSWAAAFQYFTPTVSNGYLFSFPLSGSYRVVSFNAGLSFWWTTNAIGDYVTDPGFEVGKNYLASGSSPVNGAADYIQARVFVNGVFRAPAGGNNTAITTHTGVKTLSIGNRSSDSARGSDTVPALLVIWNRALTDAEHQTWAANPWQLFKPAAARIWVATVGAQTLTPAKLSDADALYAPTLQPGAVNVTPALLADADALYAPALSAGGTLAPALLSDADTLYAPALQPGLVSVSPAKLSDADVLYAPALSGAGTLAPALLGDADALYAPTLQPGAVSVTPALLADADALYAPALSAGGTVAPAKLTDTDALYVPTLQPGAVSVSPARLLNVSSAWAPILVPGAVGVAPALLADADALYPPWLGAGSLAAPLVGARVTVSCAPDRATVSCAPDRVTVRPRRE